MIKAIIFDMDGLIIDSEPIQSRAFEAIIKQCGKKPVMNKDGVVQTIGIGDKQNLVVMKKKYRIKEDVNKLVERRNRIYVKLLRKSLKAMPDFYALIKAARKNGLKTAIASSSARMQVNAVVSGLKISVDATVSGDETKRPKPYPDIFLLAAKKLGVNPGSCIVLEDSGPGVEAAKRANMKVIAVPNEFTKKHDFSKADMIVGSLKDINMESFPHNQQGKVLKSR